jgi:hypothetical protein
VRFFLSPKVLLNSMSANIRLEKRVMGRESMLIKSGIKKNAPWELELGLYPNFTLRSLGPSIIKRPQRKSYFQ